MASVSRDYNDNSQNNSSRGPRSFASNSSSIKRTPGRGQESYQRIKQGSLSSVGSNSKSLISNRQAPTSQFDLVTLLEVSQSLTSRQKQLLIAIQQSDASYLVDQEIMGLENLPTFDFRFSSFNMTPLMFACAIGDLNVVRILLQSVMRETLNHVDSQGFNCLYYAVYHCHLDIAKMLKKVYVDYQSDKKGTTCLHVAIMRNHMHIVQFFLKKTSKNALNESVSPRESGIKMSKQDEEKAEKQHLNYIRSTNQAIQWEKQIDIDEQRANNGISPVFFAIRSGSLPLLKMLRDYGANFNLECMSESQQKMRPIQYAVYRGDYSIFQQVLQCNADDIQGQFGSQMSQTGSTLLHLNAFRGNADILRDLLKQNLNPFAQNKQGDTCVHIAIRRKHVEFVYEVISWCVSKNISSSQAEIENTAESLTPYMTAVLRDQFDIANQLLKNNLASRGYVNREGRDIRQIAEDGNKIRALAYLDNKEIPRVPLKRDGSVDSVPIQISQHSPLPLHKPTSFNNRKASIDPITRKQDDIFGKSFSKEHQDQKIHAKATTLQQDLAPQEEVKLPVFDKSRDFEKPLKANEYSSVSHSQIGKAHGLLSNPPSAKASGELRKLMVSPLKQPVRAPKMPKLELTANMLDQDDVDKVNLKDFIKNNSTRR